jgi:hypothetical protein
MLEKGVVDGGAARASMRERALRLSIRPRRHHRIQVLPQDHSLGKEMKLDVVSLYGRIKICYEGEVSDESELERFSRHLKESGPIVSVVKFATRKARLK